MQSHKVIENIRTLKVFLKSGNDEDLNRIADFFPTLVYIYDAEKREITFSNKKFEQWLGLTPERLAVEFGNNLLNLVHPDDRELVKTELRKFNFLKDNDSLTYTARFQTRENDWNFFRTEGMVFSRNDKGNASSFLFISRDASIELKGSEELEASRNFFRETEKLLQFGSWRWDPLTDTLDWSEGMYDLLEYEVKPDSLSLKAFAEYIVEEER